MHQLAQKLQKYHVILGSASPRRKELLQGLDIPFDVILKNTQEIIDATLPFEQIPLDIAQQKFKAFLPDLSAQDFLITADTLVFCEGKSVGKPKNKIEAKEMKIAMMIALPSNTVSTTCGTTFSQRFVSNGESPSISKPRRKKPVPESSTAVM